MKRHLEEHRLSWIGTVAAGAVHEIRSPLCTMAVLVEDMLARARSKEFSQDLRNLSAQIDVCRHLIARIAETGRACPVDVWVERVVTQWRRLRPGARLACRLGGPRPAAHIRAHGGLDQALLTLLNNAADAARGTVELEARWNRSRLVVRVLDHGPGIPPRIARALGKRIFPAKAGGGLGIGLVLAAKVIRHSRGRLKLQNRPGGGTSATLVLPLRPVAARRQ